MIDPIHSEIISREELEDYWDRKYLVTTIIPIVPTPKKNIRVLTQEELDDLLDYYKEYAEFLVEIKPIGE